MEVVEFCPAVWVSDATCTTPSKTRQATATLAKHHKPTQSEAASSASGILKR